MENFTAKYDITGDFHQGVAIVIKGDKYGAILMGGSEIIPPKFQFISNFKDGIADAILNNKTVKINLTVQICLRDGNKYVTLPEEYDEGTDYSETLALVRKGDFWGAIDTDGNLVIDCIYDHIEPCKKGLIVARTEGKYQVLSVSGKLLIDGLLSAIIKNDGFIHGITVDGIQYYNNQGKNCIYNNNILITLNEKYDFAFDFIDGYARVRKGNKWGIITTTQHICLQCDYDYVSAVTHGHSIVRKGKSWFVFRNNSMLININGEYSNVELLSFNYLTVSNPKGVGLMTVDGDLVVEPQQYKYSIFRNSLSVLIHSGILVGLYTSSRQLIKPRYRQIIDVLPDGFMVEFPYENHSGKIDRKGNFVLQSEDSNYTFSPPCLYAEVINRAYFKATNDAGKKGLIDLENQSLIPYEYSDIQWIEESYYLVSKQYTEIRRVGYSWERKTEQVELTKYGIYDDKFNKLIECEYDSVERHKDCYIVQKDDLYGVIDLDGEFTVPCVYSKVEVMDNEYIKVYGAQKSSEEPIKSTYRSKEYVDASNMVGLYNQDGEKIVPCIFKSISTFKDGIAIAITKNDNHQKIDVKGNIVIQYEDGSYIDLPDKYELGFDFENQVAKVILRDYHYELNTNTYYNYIYVNKDFNPSILTDGKLYVLPEDIDIYAPFEGKDFTLFKRKNKVGVINKYGEIIVDSVYEDIDLCENFVIGYADEKKDIISYNGSTVSKEEGSISLLYRISGLGYSQRYLEYKVGELTGVIDADGNIILEPKYEAVRTDDIVFQICLNGKWGMLSKKNIVLQETIYDNIGCIGEGCYLLYSNDLKGVCNKFGEILLEVKYNNIHPLIEQNLIDYYIEESKGNRKYYNSEFKEISYEDTYSYKLQYCKKEERKEIVLEKDVHGVFIKYFETTGYNSHREGFDLYDESGNNITNSKYSRIERLTEDLFQVSKMNGYNRIEGIIDYTGKEIIDVKYYRIELINNVFVVVSSTGGNYKYGMFSLNGGIILDTIYDSINNEDENRKTASDNCFIVSKRINEKLQDKSERFPKPIDKDFGLVDERGKWILEIKYKSISFLNNGVIQVEDKNGFERYVNKDGISVRNESGDQFAFDISRYEFILENYRGICAKSDIEVPSRININHINDSLILLNENGKRIVRINLALKNGAGDLLNKYIIEDKFDWALDSENHYVIVIHNNKWGVVDAYSDKTIIPIEYDYITMEQLSENAPVFIVEKNSLNGVANASGVIILPVCYQSIQLKKMDNGNNAYIVEKDNRKGVVSSQGEYIVTENYDGISISEKYIVVRDNSRYGLFQIDGTKILDAKYISIVGIDDLFYKRSIIDRDINRITSPFYTDDSFGKIYYDDYFSCYIVQEDDDTSILADASGKIISQGDADTIEKVVSEYFGLCIIVGKNYTENKSLSESSRFEKFVCDDGYVGLKDNLGQIIISPNFRDIYQISDSHFEVYLPNEGSRRRVINLNGDFCIHHNGEYVVFPYKYDKEIAIGNGLVKVSQNKLWGVVDYRNEIVLPIQFSDISDLDAGLLCVRTEENNEIKYGVYNVRGEVVVELQSKYLFIVKDRFLLYCYRSSDDMPKFELLKKDIDDRYSTFEWHLYNKNVPLKENRVFFNHIEYFTPNLIKVAKSYYSAWENRFYGEKEWGLIDYSGNLVIDMRYNFVKNCGEYVYLSNSGETIILTSLGKKVRVTKYVQIEDFADGFAIVKNSHKLYGLIDSAFNEVVPCRYSNLEAIGGGFYKSDVGIINHQGCLIKKINGEYVVFDKKYMDVKPFNNTSFLTEIIVNVNEYDYGYRYGLISEDLKEVFPPIFERIYLINNKFIKFKYAGKYGVADLSGSIIISNKYGRIRTTDSYDNPIKSNVFIVYNYEHDRIKKGLISNQFEELIAPECDVLHFEKEGKVVFMKNGKWGYYDIEKQEIVALPQFAWVRSFNDNIASVNINGEIEYRKYEDLPYKYLTPKNGKWGFISIDGSLLIDCIYENVESFSEGLAAVKYMNKWGFINKEGKVTVPFEYDEFKSSFQDGQGELIKNDEVFVFDIQGEIVNSYVEEDNNYYDDYDDTPSIYDNPYYNDNVDMDQQSIEFWNSL